MTPRAPEPAAPDDPTRAGVPLSRHAALVAAQADELPMDRALALLDVPAPTYPAARAAWSIAIASDRELFALYGARLAAAEDRLARTVAPIDADLPAWMGFLAAYGAHPAPNELLRSRQLRLPDLSRLSRRWARRMEAEPALRDEAKRLRDRGEIVAVVPALTLGESDLAALAGRARSEAPAAAPTNARAAPAFDPDELTLDRYAALLAELEAYPASERAALASFGLTASDLARTRARYDAALAADAELARDYRTLFALAARRIERRGRALVAEPPAERVDRGPPSIPRAPPAPLVIEAPAVAVTPPSPLRATVMALPHVPSPALPFAEPRKAPPASLAVTMPPPVEPSAAPALPFAGPSATDTAAPKEEAPARAAPKSKRRPRVGSGTADLSETARKVRATIPFEAAGPRPTRSAARNKLEASSMSLEIPRGLLPITKSAEPAAPSAPGTPRASAEATPAPPALSLEQHASLTVELALPGANTAAVLARYRLDEAARVALDAHYRRAIDADPALRARWNAAYRSYYEWVVQGGRR
jgi:hypothetical protein